jgi:large repetitive protein
MTKARTIADLGTGFVNISDTGTEGTKVASGTTAQRGSTAGQLRFNSDTGLAEYYTGTEFKIIDSPPTVTAVSPLEVDSTVGGNITFTITGSNFGSGAVAKFVGNDATEITASTTTINSSSSISAIIARSSFVNAKEPYDVRVINTSGLSAILDDQINVDTSPAWVTASGSLGSFNTGASVNVSATATDADGDTITYSVLSGSLPAGFSLNSTTGAITGTVSSYSNLTSSFTLRATANSKTADRAFTITEIFTNYFGDGSDGSLDTTP